MSLGRCTDTERLQRIQRYKRTIASRYRAVRHDELEHLPPGQLYVSPKVDGELWCVSVKGGEATLIAPNGRELTGGVPVLSELATSVASRSQSCLIAGELFALGGGSRPRVGDVATALGSSGDPKRLGFVAFDLLSLDEEEPPDDYLERLAKLQELFEGGKRAKVIKTSTVATSAVPQLYAEYVESGKAEGLVARAPDGRIFKIKPAFHLDCAIIGYTQRQESPDQARSLLLGLMRADGTMQIVGSCGNLGPDERRREIHALLKDHIVPSEFRRVSRSGAMYQLLKPKVVIEIVTTDLQAEDGGGAPIRQWAVALDESRGWTAVAPVNGASLLHPVLVRVRDDKSINNVDVRVAQISERCLALGLNETATTVELPKSEVLRREVYTKTSKGMLAVRKLVMWKTNKESHDPSFPAFVVHFTDYSASRSSPLKREVRLASTLESAESVANDIIAAQIKKGWTRV